MYKYVWGVTCCDFYNIGALKARLKDDWEPFAVTGEPNYQTIWLRKKVKEDTEEDEAK